MHMEKGGAKRPQDTKIMQITVEKLGQISNM